MQVVKIKVVPVRVSCICTILGNFMEKKIRAEKDRRDHGMDFELYISKSFDSDATR